MIFPYWEVQREDGTRWLPLLPVTLYGQSSELSVLALVDSGAEHSVFGMDIARAIGISLRGAARVAIFGVGGQESPGYLIDVAFRLGRYRWTAPAIFSDAIAHRAILGQAGFFEFFTVTFRRNQGKLEIRRSFAR